jgi:hypothetical protein
MKDEMSRQIKWRVLHYGVALRNGSVGWFCVEISETGYS